MSIAIQPIDRIFRSGERVPCAGVYRMDDGRSSCAHGDVVFISGDMFPKCFDCGGDAEFRLIRSAPYIGEDPDFCD